MKKRGEGNSAVGLIGVITLIFVFYILFLPSESRRSLLEEGTLYGDNDSYDLGEHVLLSESVGRLSFVSTGQFDHPLPNVFLVERQNAQVLKEENPFVVRKSFFSEDRKVVRFDLDNPKQVDNVLLTFQVSAQDGGILGIKLNSQLLFENEIVVRNPPPVRLPTNLLREINELEFFVTGGLFGGEYSLTDVKVVGDILDVSNREAVSTFSLSNVEIGNFDSAHLLFYPICDQNEAGLLTLTLNGNVVYSSVPACESLNRQELYTDDLREGKNTLVMRIDKGSYRFEQIRVRTNVKPSRGFIEYFHVDASLYEDILQGRNVILEIEFVDDNRVKRLETSVNGIRDVIDQRAPFFVREISRVVREGSNYIELLPLSDVEVVRAEVRVE
ncbi:hypothetical protein COV18_03500 [Candidatus Woesearchaeota archaeon CG10_big_fil_rev_8_21_14_0_10_37_12]|nr:MAG: hypothetical protein COV18_03500 [Candidatus Woesearchaeota archaeon CG10_big_fil_rev_8_21_14_0_10_37_12]